MNRNKLFLIGISLVAVTTFAVLGLYKKSESLNAPEANPKLETSSLIKEHSPILGAKDAKVTIVEFLDPECEACRAMYPIVKQLMDEYKNDVRLVIRYMPFHGNSMFAASALEEAKDLGKYEEALFTLFKYQPEWGSHHNPRPELLVTYLEDIGIDKSLLEKEYLLSKHKSKIDIDFEDGQKLGVQATPTFFINGEKLPDIGREPLKHAIEKALDRD